MLANKCDICNTYYDLAEDPNIVNNISLGNSLQNTACRPKIRVLARFDVCPDCSEAIHLLLVKLGEKAEGDQNESGGNDQPGVESDGMADE